MADALCGPTNALSSLQKHTQVDRSLQQDRLASRPQQRENFRSSPGPSNALLDAEFEAFQNGRTPPLQHLGPAAPHHPALRHAATAPVHAGAGLPSWATDFQQLSIHEARQSPIPAARFRHEAPMQRPSGGSWHAEFMRQDMGKTGTPPPLSAASTFGQGYTPMSPMSPMNAGFGGMGLGMGGGFASQQFGQQQQQHNVSQQVDMFDDAAFAAAFDNAAAMIADSEPAQKQDKGKGRERETEAKQEPQSQQEQFSLDHACVDAPEPFFIDQDLDMDVVEPPTMQFRTDGQVEMQSDAGMLARDSAVLSDVQEATANLQEGRLQGLPTMPTEHIQETHVGTEESLQTEEEPIQEERMDPKIEADELSRTAGQLLDNLKHENSDKFAKSSFMALMRQLRDREVKVEGDHFVEVSGSSSSHGHSYDHHTPEPDLGSRGEFSESDWA